MTTIVLVHGTATTPAIWDDVAALLRADGHDVLAPERPRTGDLARELAWLGDLVGGDEGAWVVGVSGGATLGLAAACAGMAMAGAVLHEPAVGSLVPNLLAPVAAAFASGGTAALGEVLYGSRWSLSAGPAGDDEVTARELAMFRGFEPSTLPPSAGRVLVTYGALSLPVRERAADAAGALGASVEQLPGVGHLVPVEDAAGFAAVVRRWVGEEEPGSALARHESV